MKIRNGFVSNSSSSSFIVVFKDKPKTKEELKILLFGDTKKKRLYDFCKEFTTDDLSKGVFSDITKSMNYTEERRYILAMQLLDEYEYIFSDSNNCPYEDTFNEVIEHFIEYRNDIKFIFKLMNFDNEIFISNLKQYIDNAIHETFGDDINLVDLEFFTYCDECGEYQSLLEHGDTFKNLPHETFDYH